MSINQLAALAIMSERTFLRHFTSATLLKPMQYIQRVRVQKACELLESSTLSFEQISASVGYDDVNSFRKVFIKVIGLSPSAFKARFV
jgi:transcriptional regulator GlxA family with amidase domain